MIDKNVVGREFPETSFEIEKGKIREFVRAIGDKNPVYCDEEASQKAGFTGLAIPPTFPTVMTNASGLVSVLEDLKVDMAKLLHGSQEYEYIQPIQSGDTITCKMKITDVFEKSGRSGVMDFVVLETTYVNQNGQTALRDKCTFVLRR